MAAEHLRRLPFDLFARYRLAARLLEGVAGTAPVRVLELGGAGVLASFAPDHHVVGCGIAPGQPARPSTPPDVRATEDALPFPDGTFDVVVSLDTLEHVTPARRGRLVSEALRVSGGWLLLGCPCATPGVAEADAALLAFLRARFGEDFESVAVLTEHLAFGHPDPDEVEAVLSGAGADVARVPSGRLDRWLPMMILFHDLMGLGRDDPVERVQDWFNTLFADDDARDPAYRQMFVARHPDAPGPSADEVVRDLRAPVEGGAADAVAFEALRIALTEGLVSELEGVLAARDALERELLASRDETERQTGRADAAELHVRSLLAFRDRVINHPAAKLRRSIRRGLGSD